eukprot:1137333-Pelagomonas_calceolata.AAC.13
MHTHPPQACADKLDAELTKYGVPPKFPDAEEVAAAEVAAAAAAGEATAEEVGGPVAPHAAAVPAAVVWGMEEGTLLLPQKNGWMSCWAHKGEGHSLGSGQGPHKVCWQEEQGCCQDRACQHSVGHPGAE